MLVFYMLTLLMTEVNTSSTDQNEDRKEKRRTQNSRAAKKSYENKKKERQLLQQKNTQLVELQKKLLRDRSRLQSELKLFEHIAKSMDHSLKTCQQAHEQTSEPKIEVSTSRKNVSNAISSYDSSDQALDLSVKSSRFNQEKSMLSTICKSQESLPDAKSRALKHEHSSEFKTSSLVKEVDKINLERDTFIPRVKKVRFEV